MKHLINIIFVAFLCLMLAGCSKECPEVNRVQYLKIDNSEIRRMIEDYFPKKEDLEGYNNEYYYYYRNDPVVLIDCEITIKVEYESDYENKVMELLDKYPTICNDDVIKIYDYIDTNNHMIKLFIIFDNVKKTIEFYYSNTL